MHLCFCQSFIWRLSALVCRTPAGRGMAHHVPQLGAQVSWAGGVSMIIPPAPSSACERRLNERLGTGRVTAISVAATAAALLGFSFCMRSGSSACGLSPMGWARAAWMQP